MLQNKNKNTWKNIPSDPYSGQSEQRKSPSKLPYFIIIIVFVAAVGLIGWYLSELITTPFDPQISNTNEGGAAQVAPGATAPLAGIESLRTKDTDADGVSDYDEFYIFKTSPYIADSDSDGISDKDEIDIGSDPNCPEGENCNRTIIADQNTSDDIFGEISPSDEGAPGVSDPDDVTADELRQILQDAGASEEELSQISDEELLQTYREIQSDRGITTDTASNENSNEAVDDTQTTVDPIITLEFLQNLSPEEIRQFLIDSGVPEDTLAQIDDDTLQQIFDQSLQQNAQELNLQGQ